MRLNSVLEHSEIYGFESTYVIWTQGCSIRCRGCWNTFAWDKKGGYEKSVQEIVSDILKSNDKCVTILGGEPLEQEEELFQLVKTLKSEYDKGIILYSGKEKEEVLDKEIFKYVDIAICGPYVEEKRILDHQLMGSSNQEAIFLTDRYKDKEDKLYNGTQVEIIIDEKNGTIEFVGYPEDFFDSIAKEKRI